tara:strand:+ start:173 stop:361 length:189 start_codon:yes stop_codon:yes gene_type:complete
MSKWTLRVEGHEEQCPKREMEGWEYSFTNYQPQYMNYCTCGIQSQIKQIIRLLVSVKQGEEE